MSAPSTCSGLRKGVCPQGCPHARPHYCTNAPDVCIQGNRYTHTRVNVTCEPCDPANKKAQAKQRLDRLVADAEAVYHDAIAEAQEEYDDAVARAEEEYADACDEANHAPEPEPKEATRQSARK